MASENQYQNQGLRSGVEDQLLEQAVAWAGGGVAQGATVPLPAVGWAGLFLMGGVAARRPYRVSQAS